MPAPALTYRVTGGQLDFYIFFGPEPENVIQQLTHYIGRSFMPPYWALGHYISRYGYKNIEDMRRVLDRYKAHSIPVDTQIFDVDHEEKRKDYIINGDNWQGLPNLIDYLHQSGMKTVIILDPAILNNDTDNWIYNSGKLKDVFIKKLMKSSDDAQEMISHVNLLFRHFYTT